MVPMQAILSAEKTTSLTTLRKIILKLPRYLFVVFFHLYKMFQIISSLCVPVMRTLLASCLNFPS